VIKQTVRYAYANRYPTKTTLARGLAQQTEEGYQYLRVRSHNRAVVTTTTISRRAAPSSQGKEDKCWKVTPIQAA
jgi:hypothetical protein